MRSKYQTLGEFIIENQNEFEYSTGELPRLINAIRLAAKVVNHKVNQGCFSLYFILCFSTILLYKGILLSY